MHRPWAAQCPGLQQNRARAVPLFPTQHRRVSAGFRFHNIGTSGLVHACDPGLAALAAPVSVALLRMGREDRCRSRFRQPLCSVTVTGDVYTVRSGRNWLPLICYEQASPAPSDRMRRGIESWWSMNVPSENTLDAISFPSTRFYESFTYETANDITDADVG